MKDSRQAAVGRRQETSPQICAACLGDASRPALVRFEIRCRGCGKLIFNHTDTIAVAAGANMPTMVLSTGVDPHRCERSTTALLNAQ
jgi:hypothetical protein